MKKMLYRNYINISIYILCDKKKNWKKNSILKLIDVNKKPDYIVPLFIKVENMLNPRKCYQICRVELTRDSAYI